MATKFTASGFSFSLGSEEMSGIYHQIETCLPFAKQAKNKASIKKISALVNQMDYVVKQIASDAERQLINELLSSLKESYTSILDISRGQTRSSDAKMQKAGILIYEKMKKLGDVFKGSYEKKWGSIQNQMSILEQISTEDWSAIGCLPTFKAMQKKVTTNADNFLKLVEKLVSKAKKEKVGPYLKALAEEARLLCQNVSNAQLKDKTEEENEEELAVALIAIFKKARQNQDRIAEANKLKKAEKDNKKNNNNNTSW